MPDGGGLRPSDRSLYEPRYDLRTTSPPRARARALALCAARRRCRSRPGERLRGCRMLFCSRCVYLRSLCTIDTSDARLLHLGARCARNDRATFERTPVILAHVRHTFVSCASCGTRLLSLPLSPCPAPLPIPSHSTVPMTAPRDGIGRPHPTKGRVLDGIVSARPCSQGIRSVSGLAELPLRVRGALGETHCTPGGQRGTIPDGGRRGLPLVLPVGGMQRHEGPWLRERSSPRLIRPYPRWWLTPRAAQGRARAPR